MYRIKHPRSTQQELATYVVEIFICEAISFNLADTIDEQRTCRTHEAARSRSRESLLEHVEKGMGIKGRVLVSRSVWRRLAGRWLNQDRRADRRRRREGFMIDGVRQERDGTRLCGICG